MCSNSSINTKNFLLGRLRNLILALIFENDCGALGAGYAHERDHLSPAFQQYIKSQLTTVIQQNSQGNICEKMICKIQEIIQEHEALIRNAKYLSCSCPAILILKKIR